MVFKIGVGEGSFLLFKLGVGEGSFLVLEIGIGEGSFLVLELGIGEVSFLVFQLVGVYVVVDEDELLELLAVFQLGVDGVLGDDGDDFSGEDLFEDDNDNFAVSLFLLESNPKLSFLTAGVISLPVSSSVFLTLLTTGLLTTGTIVSGMFTCL